MTILVCSDSHGSRDNMERVLNSEPHDLAVHLGDHMLSSDYMDAHFDYWVAGNNDYEGKDQLLFSVDGIGFLAVHGHNFFAFTYEKWLAKMADFAQEMGAQVVLFGHSHFPDKFQFKQVTVANPGSIAQPRFSRALDKDLRAVGMVPTYMVITIEKGVPSFAFKTVSK